MKKNVVVALALLALVAVAGYFGFRHWATVKVDEQVAEAFAAIRATGADARYASANVDPEKRVITITGILITGRDGISRLKVDKLVAAGASPPRDGRFSAEALDLDGTEVTLGAATEDGSAISYSAPRILIDRYTGPLGLVAPSADSGTPNALRAALSQLAAITAAKVTVPELKGRVFAPGANPIAKPDVQPQLQIAYENLAAEGIEGGKIRSIVLDSGTFSGTVLAAPADDGAPKPHQVNGEIRGVVAANMDVAPYIAALSAKPDAVPPPDEPYQLVMGKAVTGPYSVSWDDGTKATAASMLLERVGIRPTAFTAARIAELNALSQKAGAKGGELDDEEAERLATLSRDALNAVAIGVFAVSDTRTKDKNGNGQIASVRIEGLAAGRLDELALVSVNGTDAEGRPVKIGGFTVRQLDLGHIMELAGEGGLPSIREGFQILSSVELTNAEIPVDGDGNPGKEPLKIGTFALSWGNFLGDLPTKLSFKLADASGPISAGDGEPFTYLANAGIKRANVSADLTLGYDAATSVLTLKPAGVTVDKAFAVDLEAGIGNLPKVAFESEEAAAAAIAEAVGRPARLTVRNLGLAELMLKQLSDASGTTPEEMKQDLIATVDELSENLSLFSPDVPAVASAVKSFIRTPGTLTITATPKGEAPLLPLLTGESPFALLQAYSLKAEATAP